MYSAMFIKTRFFFDFMPVPSFKCFDTGTKKDPKKSVKGTKM